MASHAHMDPALGPPGQVAPGGMVRRRARQVRGRLLMRRALGGLLASLSLPLLGLGAWLLADQPLLGMSRGALWGAAALFGLPTLAGLGWGAAALLGRRMRPLISRSVGLDPPLAEGLRSHEELERGAALAPLGEAFRAAHAGWLDRRLALLSPARLVPLGGLSNAYSVWLLTLTLAAAGLAWQPQVAQRLVRSLGWERGPDRLPLLLPGVGSTLEVEISPPRYTGLPVRRLTPGAEPFEVPEGSRLRLSGEAPVPVVGVWACLPGGQLYAARLLGLQAFELDASVAEAGEVVLGFETAQGVRQVAARGPRFTVRPDAAPTLTVTPAQPVIEREEPGSLALRFEARDDYGLLAVRLRWQVEGGEPGERVLRRGSRFGPERKTGFKGEHRFDLRRLKLSTGSSLRFSFEAQDNRSTQAERGLTRSPEQVVRIVGRRSLQQQVLDVVRALLEQAVGRLAARLEESPAVACELRLEGRRGFVRADETLARAVQRLEERSAGDGALPLLLRRGIADLARPRRQLVAALAREGATLQAPGGAPCDRLKRIASRSALVASHLETLVLGLDDLAGRAVLEEMQDKARRLEQLVAELSELSAAQRQQPTAERARQIEQRLAEARQALQQLASLRASLQDDALDEHVNRYAYERQQTEDLLGQVARRQPGAPGAGTSAPPEDPLEKLKRQVERLREALAEGLDRFRSYHPVSGERELRRVADHARQLAAEQERLERRASGAPSPAVAVEQERLARQADQLARQAGAQVPQAGEAAAEAAGQMRKQAGRLRQGAADPRASRAARRALDRAARALDEQGRVSPPGRGQRQGGEGLGGHEEVAIPPAGGALPRALRDAILEGGRSDWPAGFAPALRRYYEGLLR